MVCLQTVVRKIGKRLLKKTRAIGNQVLLQKDDVKDVLESYCIVGFPHIILVDPEGKIVAKELRGDDLYNTVEKFVNGAKIKKCVF